MGESAEERPKLTPLVLPRRGLDELLRGWTSDGQVFDALSAVSGDGTDVVWSARDVERRAARVLLGEIESDVRLLPETAAQWRENLPVTVTSSREVSTRPVRPMDWAWTVRRYGWPPHTFVGHPRSRVRDEIVLQVLTWTARRLEGMVRDVRSHARLLVGRLEPQVFAMVEVVDRELAEVEIVRPDRLDLRALGSSGTPWSTLAAVANALLRAETDLEFLAFQLIEPVAELEWRLFHLSVLGEVLSVLRRLGGRVRWNAPLSASNSSGPQFQVIIGQHQWDLWFEVATNSRYYGARSPYRAATVGVSGTQQPIGADIMLCLPNTRAMMLECKWSADRTYVGRDGYHQASSYLVEARSGIADDAWSYIVGPEEVVTAMTEAELQWPGGVAKVGVCNIGHLDELIRAVLELRTPNEYP